MHAEIVRIDVYVLEMWLVLLVLNQSNVVAIALLQYICMYHYTKFKL